MLSKEPWYKEALGRDRPKSPSVGDQLRSLTKTFEMDPSWENLQKVLIQADRVGTEFPINAIFAEGANWKYLFQSLRSWIISHPNEVGKATISALWIIEGESPGPRWPLNVPYWVIQRSQEEDLPSVEITSIYAFTDSNYEEYLAYDNLEPALEVGRFDPSNPSSRISIFEHSLENDEWVPDGPIPQPSSFPTTHVNLKTLIETLASGFEEEGGVWQKETDPEETFSDRYPGVDGVEILFIAPSVNERNWQILDAEITQWVKEAQS